MQHVKDFITKYAPYAIDVAEKYNIPVNVMLAQAALESAWGKAYGVKEFNSLFGYKTGAGYTGKYFNTQTKEVISGSTITITDAFRAYDSPEEAFDDYAKLVTGKYYAKCTFGKFTDLAFITGVKSCGYATDPDYVAKIMNIIQIIKPLVDVEVKKKSKNKQEFV